MTDRELLQQLLAVLLDYPAEEKSVEAIRTRLAQPEKEWVGLTDAEVEKVFFDMGQFAKIDLKTFARAIEAKLKEKNT